MLIGYARVSTQAQDNELQLSALRKAGVRKIFQEKRSAVKHRQQLLDMLDQVREGDTVVVYKLDRLARSVRDLMNIVERIESVGATFRSLTEQLDTTIPAGKLAFQMIGAVAEFERNIIRERCLAGAQLARANGVQLGRKFILDDTQSKQLAKHWSSGRYSKNEMGRMYGISVSTVKRTLWRLGLDTVPNLEEMESTPAAPPKKSTRALASV